MDLLSAVAAILLSKLDEEVQNNCPNLSRIPSTGIIKFLDHFASLPAAERGPLLERQLQKLSSKPLGRLELLLRVN